MACNQDMQLIISSYVDGEATAEEAAKASEHLESCSECRQMAEEWREQKQLFEWAHTFELPEMVPMSEVAPQMEHKAEKKRWTFTWPKMQRRWAAGVAAAVLVIVALYMFVIPPALHIGESVNTKKTAKSARMGAGVILKIGPYSEIHRVDKRTLKLDKGWVHAKVNQADSITIRTDRMEVTDIGTEFRVSTGKKLDVVGVERGTVFVKSKDFDKLIEEGNAVIVRDNGQPVIVDLPKPDDTDKGTLLSEVQQAELPTDGRSLEWHDGLQKLSRLFPNVRISGSSGNMLASGGDGTVSGVAGVSVCEVIGFKEGLRDHFYDLMQATSGEQLYCDDWEIPVAVIQITGKCLNLPLRQDVYYVRLTCTNGTLSWTLTGSSGNQVSAPVDMLDDNPDAEFRNYYRFAYRVITRINNKAIKCLNVNWVDWPGDATPSFTIELQFTMTEDQMYLDYNRTNAVLFAWNENACQELTRVKELETQNGAGTALLGVIISEVSMVSPKAGPGVHPIRFVQNKAGTTAYIELGSIGENGRVNWMRLQKEFNDKQMEQPNRIIVSQVEMAEMYGHVELRRSHLARDQNDYPLKLSIEQFIENGKEQVTWAQGWIRLPQP